MNNRMLRWAILLLPLVVIGLVVTTEAFQSPQTVLILAIAAGLVAGVLQALRLKSIRENNTDGSRDES